MKEVPPFAHILNIFFAVALYKHEVLFSSANQRKIEQWIEANARLYLHDKTAAQRKSTLQWLIKHRECVWKNAEALFSFEGILHAEVSSKMKQQQQEVTCAWEEFYSDIEIG